MYPVRSGSTQNSKRGKRLDGLTKKFAGLIQNFPDVTLLLYGIFNKMLFKEYPNGLSVPVIFFKKISNIIYVTV